MFRALQLAQGGPFSSHLIYSGQPNCIERENQSNRGAAGYETDASGVTDATKSRLVGGYIGCLGTAGYTNTQDDLSTVRTKGRRRNVSSPLLVSFCKFRSLYETSGGTVVVACSTCIGLWEISDRR